MQPRPDPGRRLVHPLAEAGPRSKGRVLVVHPGALPPTVHRHLADALPDGVGVDVLDLQGLGEYADLAASGCLTSAASVESLARRLTTEIDDRVPLGGRYVLVGWSFGGVVAHAMTCHDLLPRLPERLVLLDSIAPVPGYKATVEELEPSLLVDWFAMYLGARRGQLLQPAPDSRLDRLDWVLEAGLQTGALAPGTGLPGLAKLYGRFLDGLRLNSHLVDGHRPAVSPVPTVAVRAERSLLAEQGPLGWDRITTAPLPVITCPGDHYSMLTDPAAAARVAGVITAQLATTLPRETQR